MEIHTDTWFAGLTIAERGIVMVASIGLYLGLPLLAVLVVGRRSDASRSEVYGASLGILTAILIVGVVLSFTFTVVSGIVTWMIGNLVIIVMGGVAVLFLIALAGASSSDNYGRTRTRTTWSIAGLISGVVLAVMILGTISGFSMPNAVGIVVPLITAIVLLFVVVAVIRALSSGRGKRQQWWLVGALLATAVVGMLLPTVLDQLVPDRSGVEAVAQSYAEFYVVAAMVCVFLFPMHIGRALYKVFYGEDVTVTHTRKPRTQRQYATAGYRCGKCGRALAGPVPQCPYCGVRFGGQQSEYLPGTTPPKPTTTTTRNATPLAGIFLLLLLGLDMLYGVALFEIRDILAHSDAVALHVGGALVANAVVIAAGVLLVKRYARVNGRVERTSYY